MNEDDLRATLITLPPDSRDRLRLLLVSDQAERDAAAANRTRTDVGGDGALLQRHPFCPAMRSPVVATS